MNVPLPLPLHSLAYDSWVCWLFYVLILRPQGTGHSHQARYTYAIVSSWNYHLLWPPVVYQCWLLQLAFCRLLWNDNDNNNGRNNCEPETHRCWLLRLSFINFFVSLLQKCCPLLSMLLGYETTLLLQCKPKIALPLFVILLRSWDFLHLLTLAFEWYAAEWERGKKSGKINLEVKRLSDFIRKSLLSTIENLCFAEVHH